jgi:hypothetical protein
MGQQNTMSETINWDELANALKNKFGSCLVDEDDGEDDAYNWWLEDVTVTDIVEFVKEFIQKK